MSTIPPGPSESIQRTSDSLATSCEHQASSITDFSNSPLTPSTLIQKWVKRYRTPTTQLFLVSLISFLCPGMWNALNGLGGGGLIAAGPANTANVCLYSTFSAVGFFAGIFINKLGIKFSLCLGGFGYALYTASLLCYKRICNEGFLIFAGLLLGVCAGVFWAAQGMMTISYPGEGAKGKSIGWFWGIYNLGAVLGSVIALLQNRDSDNNSISDLTFYIIIFLSLTGSIISLFLCSPSSVIRADGTHVSLPIATTWKAEMLALIDALHSDYCICMLFPMFFASNIFYPYQFNTFNLDNFTIRTRSLNNVVYWLAEIVGGYAVGYALDVGCMRRTVKARLALLVLGVCTCAVWSGALVWEMNITRLPFKEEMMVCGKISGVNCGGIMDFTDAGYIGTIMLYASFGLLAAAYQTCLYWFLGALTTDARKIANLAGFYKGIQSAGGAVSFHINTLKINPIHELLMCWGLLFGALVVATPLIVKKVEDV